jgi:CHAT domain-containing protein
MLSACQTGRGSILSFDGAKTLARAFQYAGARSVGCSLWSVEDISTATFMTHFYTELKKGKPKEVALQKAMIATRAKWAHPYYWAGFQLVG